MATADEDEPTFAQRLLGAVTADPARPLVTWYGGLDGPGIDDPVPRVELSGASLANAVAKTTGLLVDELDLRPGARVELELPAHWQLAVWLLATWAAGGVAAVRAPDGGHAKRDDAPAVVVLGPDRLAERAEGAFGRGRATWSPCRWTRSAGRSMSGCRRW